VATHRRRLIPGLDRLEDRRVPSHSRPSFPHTPATAPAPVAVAGTTGLPGDLNGDGHLTLADEQVFTAAFGSHVGQPKYNPAADLNHNGSVGQVDGRILQRLLAPLISRGPLHIDVRLAPGEQIRPPALSANSGGETHLTDITIVGRTKPGALIYTDASRADFNFNGPAFAADSRGFFRQNVHLPDFFTTLNFDVVDPYGHRVIRAFPVLQKLLPVHHVRPVSSSSHRR